MREETVERVKLKREQTIQGSTYGSPIEHVSIKRIL